MTLQTRSHSSLLVSQISPTLPLSLLMLGPAAVMLLLSPVTIVRMVPINHLSVLYSRRILKLTWSPTRKEQDMSSPMVLVSLMILVALLEMW